MWFWLLQTSQFLRKRHRFCENWQVAEVLLMQHIQCQLYKEVQGRHYRSNVNSNVEVSQCHVTLLISTLAQQEFPVPMSFAKQKSLQCHSCTRILLRKKISVCVLIIYSSSI